MGFFCSYILWATRGGWAAGRSGGARGAREVTGSARGGAAGVPESSSMPGMRLTLVLSLLISMAIGGFKFDSWSGLQN